MLPSKPLNFETPMEKLLHFKPSYDSLRIFGCACWPNLHPCNKRKLSFRSKQCVFIGYSPLHKGVKCLDVQTGRVYISRDVVFDENVFPFASLNPNDGSRLSQKILLVPAPTSPTPPNMEGMTNHDHMQFVPATNQTQVPENSGDTAATSQQSNAGENTENGAEITSNIPHMRSGENNSSTRPGDDSPALPEKSASDHTSTSDGIYSGICARQRPRIKRAHPWAPQAGPG
jgi:histone deacetylase 1/2